MKVSQNIGIVNALIRITCGLTIVSYFTAKLTRRPWNNSYLVMIMLGAMKVAEGIVRYCPVTALFKDGEGKIDFSKITNNIGIGNKTVKDMMNTFVEEEGNGEK